MRDLFSRLVPGAAALLLLSVSLTPTPAKADAYQVFNIAATLQSGAQVSGTVTLDINPPDGLPYFTSANITATEGPGTPLTEETYQGGSGNNNWVECAFGNPNSYPGLTIYLQTTVNNLQNYQGGEILPTAYNGQAYSEFYYQDANGNYVVDDVVSGSLAPAIPPSTSLNVVSPFLLTPDVSNIDLPNLLPGFPNLQTVAAGGLAADGISGAIVLFSTTTSGDVTFNSDNGTFLCPYGSSYFSSPPECYNASQTLVVPSYNLIQIGSLFYAAAILQAPLPSTRYVVGNPIHITAQQNGGSILQQSLPLVPLPVILIHGLWGDNDALAYVSAGVSSSTPWSNSVDLFQELTYDGTVNFASASSQKSLDTAISYVLGLSQKGHGDVVGRVDVIAHSMGGLLARQYTSASDYYSLSDREQGKFHTVVTLDSPEDGSGLAGFLLKHQNDTLQATPKSDWAAHYYWTQALGCTISQTVAQCLAMNNRPITTGAIASLSPGSEALSNAPNPDFSGETWNAISATSTKGILRKSIGLQIRAVYLSQAAAPSLDDVVGAPNDAIVSLSSQIDYAMNYVTFPGLSHSTGKGTTKSVLNSPAVVKEVVCWLRNSANPCMLKQDISEINSSFDEDDDLRLAPSGTEFKFPLSAVAGKPSLVQVIMPKTLRELSISQFGPYNLSEGHEPETIAGVDGKSGLFSFQYIPHELGSTTIVTTVVLSDGTYDVSRARVEVFVDPASVERLSINRGTIRELSMKLNETIQLCPEILVRGLKLPVGVGKLAKFEVVTDESVPAASVSKDLTLTADHLGSAIVRASFAGKSEQIEVNVIP